jgi:hypothetical protein
MYDDVDVSVEVAAIFKQSPGGAIQICEDYEHVPVYYMKASGIQKKPKGTCFYLLNRLYESSSDSGGIIWSDVSSTDEPSYRLSYMALADLQGSCPSYGDASYVWVSDHVSETAFLRIMDFWENASASQDALRRSVDMPWIEELFSVSYSTLLDALSSGVEIPIRGIACRTPIACENAKYRLPLQSAAADAWELELDLGRNDIRVTSIYTVQY